MVLSITLDVLTPFLLFTAPIAAMINKINKSSFFKKIIIYTLRPFFWVHEKLLKYKSSNAILSITIFDDSARSSGYRLFYLRYRNWSRYEYFDKVSTSLFLLNFLGTLGFTWFIFLFFVRIFSSSILLASDPKDFNFLSLYSIPLSLITTFFFCSPNSYASIAIETVIFSFVCDQEMFQGKLLCLYIIILGNQKFTEASFKKYMDKYTSEPTIKILKDSNKRKRGKKSNLDKSSEDKENFGLESSQQPEKKKLKFSESINPVKKKKVKVKESSRDIFKKKDLLENVDREEFKKMTANQIIKNEDNSFSLQQYLLLKEEEMKKKEKANISEAVKKEQTNLAGEGGNVTTIDPNSLAANLIKAIKGKPITHVRAKQKLAFGELDEYRK